MFIPSRLQPFLIVGAVCIGLLALAGYDLLRERRLAVQSSKDDTRNVAVMLELQVRQKLQRVDGVLRLASARLPLPAFNPAPAFDPTSLRQVLQALQPADALIQHFEWLDAAGQLLLSTAAGTPPAAPAPAHEWAVPLGPGRADELLFARPEMAASPSSTGSPAHWVLPVARRLIGPDGRYAGALVALLELDSTQAAFASVNTGANGFVTLFLSHGWMVATLPRNDPLLARYWLDSPLFKEHLPRAPSGSVQQVVVRDATERVYSYRTLAPYPLVLSIGVSLTDALADWRQRVRWSSGLLLASVSALFWAAALLARQNRLRETAELALAESAERLRTVVDHVADGLVVFDHQGRIESVNLAVQALFGRPGSELVGQDFCALVPALRSADGSSFGLAQRSPGQGQSQPRAETSARRSDGSDFPVDIAITQNQRAGQPLFIALVRDITQSKKAQAAAALAREDAERSARFLREITDNLPLRIAYVDRARRYQFVNAAHCQRFGLPREAIIGRTRLELTGLPVPASTEAQIDKVLAGQPTRYEFEDPLAGPGHTIEAHLVPDVADDGSVRGFYAASTDITERKRQQQRLEAALTERETLLREVYYRVKNNLQVVQSLLNLQQRSLPEGPARAAIDDSVRRIRAMGLVHEKLYQTGNLSAVSLRDYTQDLLRHLGDASGVLTRGIELRADVADVQGSLDVSVPYGLLVTELVSNCLKHGFPGGRQGHVTVQLQREAGVLVLRVSDDGVGLPAAFDIEHVPSMGLQLATSLAMQLGGELHAEQPQPAKPGGGAVFTAALSRLG